MNAYAFAKARFIKTAMGSKDYPILKDDGGNLLPEVAVAGRSNVGKSSLLNHLFGSKGLVKTSSVPGKTQALNFFVIDEKLVFVDLPGYGYAQVPLSTRKLWGPMVERYLKERESLKLILFLFDIRRMPNEDDRRFLEWVIHYQKAMILVFTKVDKISTNEKKANADKILKAFGVDNIHHLFYSATKNVGRKELKKMLTEAIEDELA
ncbi:MULTISPECIES: ribosome biogenesis GTP-binding protein YihA/YsxC [unclassified Neochlamydia]|uniref:ribosome biogenesis GTP-binding protein YihA/YsxC n=1 Tax=unclassified Neochlamydia TaxID=2643326 RepID=UPI00140C80AE|nr:MULTISPECIES: ribosome biogenesis GTP-binding protein YihA/YsxC [unclassified Neochlamydia]MBS4167265.1 putative GTP-binding protein EngB [Neochlamydia sp. AcF65]MBS4169679.1 putative GTP-binding protein EngB [Neochlamydia sp. AcF95]NGY95169.1 putative GTP-binding protein EngB [Neochlamydia sp. AcF84]